MSHRFLQSELPQPEPENARFHIIPVPYEASVSYGGGTRLGPDAILEASDQLELWDGESVPADLGIYTAEPVDCSGGPVDVLERIESRVATSLGYDALPVVLGGEHTVTLGSLRALKKKYGTFGVVQIDAHADLRDTYEGTPYSHACVMRRAVDDLGLPLVQFGVRAMSLEEARTRKTFDVIAYDAANLTLEGLPDVPLPKEFPPRLYVTFDVDGLDSGIMPATGTPVPGGLDWYSALALVMRSVRGRQVIGMDVVELAPIEGFHAPAFTAARLVYALMGIVQRCIRR